MARLIETPRVADADFSKGGARSFWTRILPKQSVNYTDKSGKSRVLDFNDETLGDVKAAHEADGLGNGGTTPFVLAGKDNEHTMDPERYRGDVTQMVREDELPEETKAALIAKHGTVPSGLYGKVRFPSKKLARAVTSNPNLGVSARIREGVERSDGKKFSRLAIHVLGTMNQVIPGTGGWTPAVDLSEYASDDVIDLSGESYGATKMPKTKDKKDVKLAATATVEVPDIDDVKPEDIAGWTDEALEAFLGQYAPGEADEATEEPQAKIEKTDPAPEGTDPDPEVTLSTSAKTEDIDFASHPAVVEANRTAREALNRAAEMRWAADRKGLLGEGVPPHVLDLAEPVLGRANDTVIDLSVFEEDDVNVTEIVRELVEGYKGTIDFSAPAGHGGEGEDNAETKKLGDALDSFL